MADELAGKEASLWIETTPRTNYPSLNGQTVKCGVAVIGGGITGLMTAWFLQQAGLKIALIEKGRLVEWTSGSTTAKLTSQHYLIYKYLTDKFGKDVAKAYANANEEGISMVEKLSTTLGIDCDFSIRNAYVYTNVEKTADTIRAEIKAAQAIGLPASIETSIGLPFDVKAAIKFAHQAQFHPRKFLLGIAEILRKDVQIFENTEATKITPGKIITVETKDGRLEAEYVVEATQFPFWQPELFEKAMWTKVSYLLGVKLKPGETYPEGMYITTDKPTRTIRSHPYENGELLLFGGESHNLNDGSKDKTHYRNLILDVNKKFKVDKILYRWLADDAMTYDCMPYIGEYPDNPRILTVTGYRAWGLAWAMSASQIITNKILGKPVEWAEPFSLKRLNP